MARRLLENGTSSKDVAKAFGVGRTTLYRSLQRVGGEVVIDVVAAE